MKNYHDNGKSFASIFCFRRWETQIIIIIKMYVTHQVCTIRYDTLINQNSLIEHFINYYVCALSSTSRIYNASYYIQYNITLFLYIGLLVKFVTL